MSDEERMQPREGSEPEGQGFGAPWVPSPLTLLAEGSLVRSVLSSTGALVAFDLTGIWKGIPGGEKETISVIVKPEIAEEMGRYLIECAAAARQDTTRIIVKKDPTP